MSTLNSIGLDKTKSKELADLLNDLLDEWKRKQKEGEIPEEGIQEGELPSEFITSLSCCFSECDYRKD